MNVASEQDFDSLCRTCMHDVTKIVPNVGGTTEDVGKQWQSIFDTIKEYETFSIAELLSNTIPQIEVLLSDELPKKICCDCTRQLVNVHRFQQMCLQSEQQMRALIAKKELESKITIKDASTEDEMSVNVFLPIDVKGHDADVKTGNNLPEAEQSANVATDPLQSICEDIHHFKTVVQAVSDEFVKSEPFDDDDDPNFDYNDLETLPSKDEVKDELMTTITTAEVEVILDTSPHNCSICNGSFKEAGLLKTHMINQHKLNDDKRKDVPVQSTSPSERLRFKCDICNRNFRKPESLQKHLMKHDKRREKLPIHVCDLCDKKYKSPFTLRRHKKLRHSEGETTENLRLYKCEICPKSFKYSSTLKNHLRTHTGERPYLCPECGKSFSTESNLIQHRHRHTDDRIVECPYCPKKFRRGSDLSNHKKIHDAIKPHVCEICGAAFSHPYELKKHTGYHNGVKPYKCDFCDMRFARMNTNRCHMRTHTGEKPYKCKYCDRAFAQSGDLVKHLRSHLGENVYMCELCPLTFRLASELRAHFATHKNEDDETRERNLKALKEAEAKMQINLSGKKFQ